MNKVIIYYFCDHFVPFCCSDVSYYRMSWNMIFCPLLLSRWSVNGNADRGTYLSVMFVGLKWARIFVDVLSWRRCESCRFAMSTCPTKLRQNWRMHVNALTSWMLRWLAWSHRWRWCSCCTLEYDWTLSMCHLRVTWLCLCVQTVLSTVCLRILVLLLPVVTIITTNQGSDL